MSEKQRASSEEGKIEYLQMILSVIDRMSTSSAIFKGFTAAVLAGISALSFSEINKLVLVMSFVPILCFAVLDVYYLQLERRFRYLYKQVRIGNHDIDFDLAPPKVRDIIEEDKKTNVRFLSCCHSISVRCFYLPMIIISIVIIFLKFRGCLG